MVAKYRLTHNLSYSPENPNHAVVRAIAAAFCLILCMSHLCPHHPGTWEKGHFPMLLVNSLVARRPKPSWVKGCDNSSNLKVWAYDHFLPQLYWGSECVTRTLLFPLSQFCSPSILSQTPPSHWRKGQQPQAWSPLSSSPMGTHRSALPSVPAQFPCISSVLGGPQSHCSGIPMARNIPKEHPEMRTRKILLFRERWRFSCPKKDKWMHAAKATDAHSFFICSWF